MKKNGLVSGAIISTIGIVIAKVLGILYVIPFHAIIGDVGGALYGYAYTIYLLFMGISSAGIPLAISKITSEYQTLGYYKAKKQAFKLGKEISLILGLICFLILMIFAPFIAKAVLGNIKGANSLADITFVIRIIATAILIVPVLSVYRGYFEGHRYMSPPSVSQVIEQIVRILVIIIGSFLMLKIFKLSLRDAVGIAVFGATAGAIAAYFYLILKKKKNNNKFNIKTLDTIEPTISNKKILKKIFIYAFPLIMIDVFKSLYSYIDMVTVVKDLVNYASFNAKNAEIVMSMLSTWSAKFNMIILAISTGVIVSLIPVLTESLVKKDKEEITKNINKAIGVLIYFTIPMTLGISFLAKPIWMLFYGKSLYGPSILSFYIFVGLITAIFTAFISIVQVLKDYKMVFISLVTGVIIKILLNTNLIVAFYKMGLPAYYGPIMATIIAMLVSTIICVIAIHKKYKINYEELTENFINILCGSLLMLIVLYLVSLWVPIVASNRIVNIFIIMLYVLIGGAIYLLFTKKTKTIKKVFGDKKLFKKS
jgi:O-antigen/teichoic acid export membrane protein